MTQVFPVPPATGKGVGLLAAVIALLLGVCLMPGYVAWSTRHSRAEVSPEGLRLVGDLWGRTIPRESLRLDEGRVVDLRGEPDLQPRRRSSTSRIGGESCTFRPTMGIRFC